MIPNTAVAEGFTGNDQVKTDAVQTKIEGVKSFGTV
jgi:hypothetical protein